MSGSARAATFGLLALLLAACPGQIEPTPTKVTPEAAGPRAPAPPDPQPAKFINPNSRPDSGEEPGEVQAAMPDGLVLGPATDTHGSARADAVLTLLSDGMLAERLPLVDADPGAAFDSRLVERLGQRLSDPILGPL